MLEGVVVVMEVLVVLEPGVLVVVLMTSEMVGVEVGLVVVASLIGVLCIQAHMPVKTGWSHPLPSAVPCLTGIGLAHPGLPGRGRWTGWAEPSAPLVRLTSRLGPDKAGLPSAH